MKVAVLGAGAVGAGWAARHLVMGHDVAVHDPDPDAARGLDATLAAARLALPMLYDRALPPEGSLTLSSDLEGAVEGAGLVHESLPERLDLKRALLARLDRTVAPEVPVASSTSGFRPSALRDGLARPGRVFVAHPFVPVYLLPLVEIVGTDGDAAALDRLTRICRGVGMTPLVLDREIDGHLADRLLEAVWREALWLVRDGIATTAEIDAAITMGFGLRWAQKGLFESYRIAGGERGMAHFLAQFGPALKWPWTRLVDVPDLDDALVARIADQSDAQAAGRDIATLAAERDRNLVAILRALRGQGAGAGRVLLDHEAGLPAPLEAGARLVTLRRTVPHDWTDYNGHMNESRYGQVWSDASDSVLSAIGMGPGASAEASWFTVETQTRFLAETRAGDRIRCETRLEPPSGKAVAMRHEMLRDGDGDGARLATCRQVLVHVSMATRRAAPMPQDVARRLGDYAARYPAGD